MKKLILIMLASGPLIASAQEDFTINGKLTEYESPTIAYLEYQVGNEILKSSVPITKGVFQFKGKIAGPVNAVIHVGHRENKQRNDYLYFYIDKGTINIIAPDSIYKGIITNSTINADDKKYEAVIATAKKTIETLNIQFYNASDEQKKDQKYVDDMNLKLGKAYDEKKMAQKDFIQQNPRSYLSLVALKEMVEDNSELDVATIAPLFKSLSETLRNSVEGKKFDNSIETAGATSIGAIGPDFTQNDANGKPVSLKDFRGKYVLLDFWASWCAPCRSENPNVVRAYQRYKNQNFTVLSVSLDKSDKKDAWLAAIAADGLEWTQVSDFQFWNNEAAKKYGVTAIPQNFLIDPSGKIIGKNLRGEDLDKKLATLFN